MAQFAFLDEGRRYPIVGKVRIAQHRPDVQCEIRVQDVLLAILPTPQAQQKTVWTAFLLIVVAHVGLVQLYQHRASDNDNVTMAVPLEIHIATPVPEAQPQMSPQPAPLVPRPIERRVLATHAAPTAVPVAQETSAATSDVLPAEPAASSAGVAERPVPVRPAPQSVAPLETQAAGRMGYLSNPAPVYPDSAQDRGIEGTVLLHVRVLADGRAESVDIQQSSGWRILDDAALRTVRNWMFVPATRGGAAVDGWASVPIVFKLGK
jgi:protein TonB